MSNMSIPGLSVPTTPPPGLINAAPGSTTQTPGVTPPGGTVGAPVTSYTPQQAQAGTVSTVAAEPKPFEVTPDQTVSSQIKNIIAAGSPLMRQAETNAKNLMNQRGLINSSQGITADQSALYTAATPIATADANTYATAAANTTKAQNDALTAEAAAKNAASSTNAQLGTAVSQSNAVQGNTALSQASTASNTIAQTAQQITGSKDLAQIQSLTSQTIAKLQADTTLTAQEKQDQTSQLIAALQSNTALSVQDKAAAAQSALAAINNANSIALANIQSNTALSIEQQQTLSAQIVAGMNNATTIAAQKLVNEGNLATIKANGEINMQVTKLTNDNKLLLQTSSAATTLYQQTLAVLATIMTSKDLDEGQKTTALNNSVKALQDGLNVISKVANNQSVNSTLDFTSSQSQGTTVDIPGVGSVHIPTTQPPATDNSNPTPTPGYTNPRTGGNLSDEQLKAMGMTWPGMT